VFRNLTPAALYELYHQCEEEKVMAGGVIIATGAQSDLFYIIYSGKVDVYKSNNFKEDEIIATLHRGDVFGENALRRARHIPRSASVVAK
jgi:CRP-like cAMP-binding protein